MPCFPKIALIAAMLALALPALAQAAGAGVGGGAGLGAGVGGIGPGGVGTGIGQTTPASPGAVGVNPAPGNLTLVPGTVVTPGVAGSAVTGTVPLAGTVGSPNVGNLNPGLGANPNPGAAANSGALYPPTFFSQTPIPGTAQSTLPPGTAATTPSTSPLSPSIANCPLGVTPVNGRC
jgi:hypothetical protein